MQRLIDVDKLINDGINKGFCDWWHEIKNAETVLEIPDNPTNGDMIKAMFPKCEIMSEDDRFYHIELDSYLPTPIFKNWWNAEYKEPTTKNDLAQERYQDLIDHFGDETVAKTILESRKEFK